LNHTKARKATASIGLGGLFLCPEVLIFRINAQLIERRLLLAQVKSYQDVYLQPYVLLKLSK